MVEGVSPGGEHGFFASYDVVADDEVEALQFVSAFEPAAPAGSLRIAEAEIVESEPQPKGVYRAARGYTLFSLDGE